MSAVVDGRVEGMEVFNDYGTVARGTMSSRLHCAWQRGTWHCILDLLDVEKKTL